MAVVKNTPWQMRLKAAGLSQKKLGEIAGQPENTVSRQMRGEWELPGYTEAIITAWETMNEYDRERWLKALAKVRREKR